MGNKEEYELAYGYIKPEHRDRLPLALQLYGFDFELFMAELESNPSILRELMTDYQSTEADSVYEEKRKTLAEHMHREMKKRILPLAFNKKFFEGLESRKSELDQAHAILIEDWTFYRDYCILLLSVVSALQERNDRVFLETNPFEELKREILDSAGRVTRIIESTKAHYEYIQKTYEHLCEIVPR